MNPQRTGPNVAATTSKTEVLDQTPPHGMKGPLPPSPGVSPQTIFAIAGVVMLTALVVSLVMSLIIKWRQTTLKASKAVDLGCNPSLWAELRKAIAGIVIPSQSSTESGSDDETAALDKEWNQFSSEVSLCLRRGLELRTGAPLAESTTEEILSMLAKGRLRLVVVSDRELRDTLEQLDRIRFGGMRVSRAEAAGILESLKRWCDKLEEDDRQRIPSSNEDANRLTVDEKGGLRVFDT